MCTGNCGGNCSDCGDLTIPSGPAGNGISSVSLDDEGYLTINFTDGTSTVVGPLNGLNGTDGTDGSKWYDGIGSPSPSTGVDGDYYLDTVTGDVYEKISGVWAVTGNIKGPAGPQGIQGPPGPSGSGTAGSIDFSQAVSYTDASPTIIYDVGWNGTAVTNVATDVYRHDIGDLVVIEGTLDFTGTWNGTTSQTVYLPVPGPAMNSYTTGHRTMIVTYGNTWNYCDTYLDTSNRLIFNMPNNIPTSSTNYVVRYSLLLLFNK